MKSCLQLVLASVVILHPSVLFAATISVPADQPTIQDAINTAIAGDIVLVSPGTYVENIDFIGKAVTVASLDGAATTIIDGNGSGSVVTFANGEGTGSVLEGFTIRNGCGTGFGLPAVHFYGGGIYCVDTSPTISGNHIVNNHLNGGYGGEVRGGGIYNDGGSPLIDGNVISDNAAQSPGCWHGLGCSTAYGGGIATEGGDPFIVNNIISGNTAMGSSDGTGGGRPGRGGGIYSNGSSTVVHNVISGNAIGGQWVGQYGGGACFASDEVVTNNIVISNTTPYFAGNVGGIECAGTPSITYNDVRDNLFLNYAPGCGTPDSTNISIDPSPTDPTSGLHLMAGSPCIDAGTDAGIYKDIDGDARPQAGGFDMGADEFTDLDEDGWASWEDCEDDDPESHPEAIESQEAGNCSDGRDNDCDGLVDTDPECPECFIGVFN